MGRLWIITMGPTQLRFFCPGKVVQILKKYRESSFPRSHYNGHFEGPGTSKTKISEVVQCNL
ncbi:hypothetical protein M9458_048633, partial [Cirrhinus mrigala]